MKLPRQLSAQIGIVTLIVICFGTFFPKTTQAETDKGVGPVTEIKLEALDGNLAKEGRKVFDSKCMACHKIEERYVGPALKDVTKRRSPEWIMNMILNPAEMLEKNDVAKELLAEYLTPMTFQNVTKDETRSILEYFRARDEGKWTEPEPTAAPAAAAKDKKSTKKTKK